MPHVPSNENGSGGFEEQDDEVRWLRWHYERIENDVSNQQRLVAHLSVFLASFSV